MKKSQKTTSIFELQNYLYNHFSEKAKNLMGEKITTISNYSKSFHNCLPQNYCVVKEKKILESLDKSDVCLFGDFHTLTKYQVNFIKIIETYAKKQDCKEVSIALEALNTSDQEYIDEYLENKISEQEFIKKVDYYQKWGFPWEGYSNIFKYAKKNKTPIFAINYSNKSLFERDQLIAKRIKNIALKYGKKVFCLIGEHHLADSHLPSCINSKSGGKEKKIHLTRIISNIEYYYAVEKSKNNYSSNENLELKKDFYCILNTDPWIKWLSYIAWQEGKKSNLKLSNHNYDNSSLDLHELEPEFQFNYFVSILCRFFKNKVKPHKIDYCKIIFHNENIFDADSENEKKTLQLIAKQDYTLNNHHICKQNKFIYMRSYNLINLTQASSTFIFNIYNNEPDIDSSRNFSYYYVVKTVVTHLLSSIILPTETKMQFRKKEYNISNQKPDSATLHLLIEANLIEKRNINQNIKKLNNLHMIGKISAEALFKKISENEDLIANHLINNILKNKKDASYPVIFNRLIELCC